ncbi:hypothetical protein Tco_1038363 [Tanacetum coccineum]
MPECFRSPNLVTAEEESSALRKSTVIGVRVPRRKEPETPIPTPAENVEQVKEHIEDEELDHFLEGTKNVDEDKFMDTIFNSKEDPDTRIEPRSEKESSKVEKSADMVTINDEVKEESAGDEFELKRREKGKGIEETRDTPYPHLLDPLRLIFLLYLRIRRHFRNSRSLITDAIANHIPSQVDSCLRNYMPNNILHVHPTQNTKANAQELQYQFKKITTATAYRPSAIRPRDHDDYQDNDARPEGKSSVEWQKISEHGTYSIGELSSSQAMEQEPNPPGSSNQEQLDEFYALMEDVGIDDDEVPAEEVHKNYWKKCQEKSMKLNCKSSIPDDDIEERTSRWVNKRIKRFNIYAQYSVEHWKNMWAKQFHIKRQNEKRDRPE